MQKRRVCGAALFVAMLVAVPAFAQETQRKWAFLVGVSKYDKAGLGDLQYAETDMTVLGYELKKAGFVVKIMLGSSAGEERATRENLRRHFEEGFVDRLDRLGKRDIVLIGFSGHGQQLLVSKDGRQVEDQFFCPVDAVKTREETLLSIGTLMARIAKNSGAENNLLVIDACRDNPAKGSKGVDGSTVVELPVNLAVLFSSSAGRRSYESDELKHGILTHFLVDGLRGQAADRDGEVTWDSLVNYVKKRVPQETSTRDDGPQRPTAISNLQGTPPVLAVLKIHSNPSSRGLSAASNVASKSITNSVGMTLNLIPAGEFLMGSLATESHKFDEPQHRVIIAQPFYMSMTEVTQGQWEAVMGTTPWLGKTSTKVGLDYPATFVSWNDAADFCRQLSARVNQTYRLPTEAEWEYACRAGTSTMYCFGDSAALLKDYAWFDENALDVDEKYAHQVGSKRANTFGLFDMHGNVWEWCSDWYDENFYATPAAMSPDPIGPVSGSYRVHRGGAYHFSAQGCRAATRYQGAPSWCLPVLGFRVVSSAK